MSFLYFIPHASIGGRQTVEPTDFQKLGLGYALVPDHGIACGHCDAGPLGAGLVCTVSAGSPTPVYAPGQQTWRVGPDKRYAIGIPSDARPGPDALAREMIYGGQSVRLLDGNRWTIPRCTGLVPGRGATLPYLIDLAEDGTTPIATTHPAFEQLSSRAFDFWLMFRGAANARALSPIELVDLAVEALGVNYRLGKIESLGLLKLMGEDERNQILRAVIDADEVEAYYAAKAAVAQEREKKSTSAVSDSNTTSGAAA